MAVLVTGSIAVDHIMVFRDRFKNHILADKVHMINVSFHVPEMRKSWGGCGANIAHNLRMVGGDPLLLGTVGSDFSDYAEWMDAHGVRRDHVRELPGTYTAQAFITTDLDDNQITAFHSGAMNRAHEARIADVAEPLEAAIVGPNGKQAMLEYARELKRMGVPTVIDPGQALTQFEGEELREFSAGATVFVVNDYEWSLSQDRTGWDAAEFVARVGAVVVTLGEHGSRIHRSEGTVEVPSVRAEEVVDPTGAGDAYRAGLLLGLGRGLPLETGCRAGSLLGALKVGVEGPQGLELPKGAFEERFVAEFGTPLS